MRLTTITSWRRRVQDDNKDRYVVSDHFLFAAGVSAHLLQLFMVKRLQKMQAVATKYKGHKECLRGLPSMTSALEGGKGGSRKVDKSTDKLCDHVCDKGGKGVKKFEIFMDVIDGSPLRPQPENATELNDIQVANEQSPTQIIISSIE